MWQFLPSKHPMDAGWRFIAWTSGSRTASHAALGRCSARGARADKWSKPNETCPMPVKVVLLLYVQRERKAVPGTMYNHRNYRCAIVSPLTERDPYPPPALPNSRYKGRIAQPLYNSDSMFYVSHADKVLSLNHSQTT